MNLLKNRYFNALALPITFFTTYGIVCSMYHLKKFEFSKTKKKIK